MLNARHVFCAIVACLSVLLCSVAFGDGLFLKMGAIEAPPAIPRQHALITFRDGIETLVVESTVENDGSELAWIVPVPARPTQYEALDPGFIDTLRMYVGSRVDEGRALTPLIQLLFLLGLFWLVSLKFIPRPHIHGSCLLIVVYILLGLFALRSAARGRMAGTDGPNGSEPPPGVEILETQRVGQYDVVLLEAREAGTLQSWLKDEGFGELPGKAVRVVKSYAERGWMFVAARLAPGHDGLLRPHPIAITFPVSAPVYPMRLTGLSNRPVYLELFLVTSETTPSAPKPLELHYSGKLLIEERMKAVVCSEQALHEPPYNTWLAYRLTDGAVLDHPDASRFLWNGAILTKLAGTFTPEDMLDDIDIVAGPYDDYVRVVYAPYVAKAFRVMTAILALGFIWLVLDALFWLRGKRSVRRYFVCVAAPALIACAAAAASVQLPVGRPYERPPYDPMWNSRWEDIETFVARDFPRAWSDPETMRWVIATRLEAVGMKNGYFGGPIREEASPGNYKVYKGACGVYVVYFDVFEPRLILHSPEHEPEYVTTRRREFALMQKPGPPSSEDEYVGRSGLFPLRLNAPLP